MHSVIGELDSMPNLSLHNTNEHFPRVCKTHPGSVGCIPFDDTCPIVFEVDGGRAVAKGQSGANTELSTPGVIAVRQDKPGCSSDLQGGRHVNYPLQM
jgi:hypothetical protein